MSPPATIGEDEDTPVMLGAKLDKIAKGVREITDKHKALTVRGRISLGNWIAIVILILSVATATAALANAYFYPRADGRVLEERISNTLTAIDAKLAACAKED